MKGMTWRPLLQGIDAERADVCARGIATALSEAVADGDRRVTSSARRLGELAVFFDYAAQALDCAPYRDLSDRLLDEAVVTMEDSPFGPSLYGGFTGIALSTDVVGSARRLLDLPSRTEGDDEDLNAEIDAALAKLLDTTPWRGDYDLINGLAGIGAYFSGRLQRESGRAGLALVVERLDGLKTPLEGGVAWHTAPELLVDWQRAQSPSGYFNLGMAHGVPAVLVVLSLAAANGIEVERSRTLARGLVGWLQTVRQDPLLAGSHFAPFWTPGRGPAQSRLAWCYGDAGVAAAWLWSALLLGEQTWHEEAISILRFCSEIPPGRGGVVDAGLCHGSSGIGHLFNRVYQATGIDLFRHSAIEWFRHVFDMRVHAQYGGYRAYRQGGFGSLKSSDADPWEDDPSFLTGSVGVGLALLAAISDARPDWDRWLLLSLPTRD